MFGVDLQSKTKRTENTPHGLVQNVLVGHHVNGRCRRGTVERGDGDHTTI